VEGGNVERRKLLAMGGVLSVTAFATTVGLGATFGLFGLAQPDSAVGRLGGPPPAAAVVGAPAAANRHHASSGPDTTGTTGSTGSTESTGTTGTTRSTAGDGADD
jgi:hypothetical protein